MSEAHIKYGRIIAIDARGNQCIAINNTNDIVHLHSNLEKVRNGKIGDPVKLAYVNIGTSSLWIGEPVT